jgi:hypothetical protein
MVYSFAIIDRLNLGSAYTAGMGTDLVLFLFHSKIRELMHFVVHDRKALNKGGRFSLIICLFFVPYTIL